MERKVSEEHEWSKQLSLFIIFQEINVPYCLGL